MERVRAYACTLFASGSNCEREVFELSEKHDPSRQTAKLLWKFLDGSKRFFLASIFCAGVTALADMIQPQIVRAAVDCAIGGKEGDFPAFVMNAVEKIGGFSIIGASCEDYKLYNKKFIGSSASQDGLLP